MSTLTTAVNDLLIRQEVYQDQIWETLKDELVAMPFVEWVPFPDGETMTIPSVGDMLAEDYTEDSEVSFRPMDTGEFQFSINEYLQAGTYVTKKKLQDSFYMERIKATFPQRQERAIMEKVEEKIWRDPETVLGTSVTETFEINGALHRFSAGLSSTDNTIDLADFSYAKMALQKANVPLTNLVAIIPPEAEHKFNTLSNLVTLDSNPTWSGIVETGLSTGTRWLNRNAYGFSIYVSDRLPDSDSLTNVPNALVHRDGSTAGPNFNSVAGKPCLFFSAAGSGVVPWIGAWRQMPELDMQYNMNRQRFESVTTARYDTAIQHPENMVIAHTALAIQ